MLRDTQSFSQSGRCLDPASSHTSNTTEWPHCWPGVGVTVALPAVKWTIGRQADRWDDLLFVLRKETGRRALSKADIMRAWIDLASNDGEARSSVIAA